MPKSKVQSLDELEALKQHLSSSIEKKFPILRNYKAHQDLFKGCFKLHKTSLGIPRNCYLLGVPWWYLSVSNCAVSKIIKNNNKKS